MCNLFSSTFVILGTWFEKITNTPCWFSLIRHLILPNAIRSIRNILLSNSIYFSINKICLLPKMIFNLKEYAMKILLFQTQIFFQMKHR